MDKSNFFYPSVDGGWSQWSDWGDCSESCLGEQRRTRTCTNPAPEYCGADCVGKDYEDQDCGDTCCPGRLHN